MLYVRFYHEGKLRAQAQTSTGNAVGFADGDALVGQVLRRAKRLVTMSYMESCLQVVFNQPEIAKMQSLLDALRVNTVKTAKKNDFPSVFIAPKCDDQNDGRFEYVAVKTLPELVRACKDAESNTVLTLDLDPAVMVFFCEEAEAFEVNPVVLTGLPTADYTPAFDMRTYGFAKVNYAEALEELAVVERDTEIVARADKSEAGRSSRRGTKFEDGGGRFEKFDVSGFEPVGSANAFSLIKGRKQETADEDVGGTDDNS